jgi:hypothetical protein
MASYGLWAIVTVALGAWGLAGCAAPVTEAAPMLGAPASLGNGSVASYAELDAAGAPKVIGVMFSATALENLPAAMSDAHRCFDLNKDGKIDPAKECSAWHERVLPLPSELARRADMPFKWALLNWNPHGHIPPGVYDTPHFDVHFYLEPIENVFALEAGPCGPEHIRCDQFALARKPLPGNYVPASHVDVEAVAPAMGNHLVDVTGPEFKGEKFKRAWIFGAYDGRVTFYEEMVDRAYLLSKPSVCSPIPTPEAVAISGYYPTQTCVRYVAAQDAYTVSVEGFVMRNASAPAALRPSPPPVR